MTACSPGAESGADSPRLESCSVHGETCGGEDEQFIVADMAFDREIRLDEGLEDQLRVVIGGTRVDPEDIAAELNGTADLELRMHVDRVVTGALQITNVPGEENVEAIRTADGKTCVGEISVDKMIPSGVTLSKLSSEPGKVTCSVDSLPDHRCIIWLRLTDNGKPVVPEGTDTTDVLEDAVAVHEHEFLWATKKTVAEDMAETLNRYYSSGYTAEASEGTVTVSKKADTADSEIELQIYEG
ncbi:MAG: hypothetical protein K5767_00310 [Clostridia bacterium]|nr:hypothetical protein [Clostridia bacterium]